MTEELTFSRPRLLKECDLSRIPSARKNGPIIAAVTMGYLDIINLLMKDPRVDPSARDNYAIKHAEKVGDINVKNLLLRDKRVRL